jgi:hypothetical protein
LNDTDKERGKTIKQILYNNKYVTSLLKKIRKDQRKKDTLKTKWAKFTYIGKETKFIAKLFKNSNLKISFTTQNNIGKTLTKHKMIIITINLKNAAYVS